MLKKLFAHSMLYAIAPQIPKLANILVLPIITQFLTSTDYGIYGTLIAYSGLLGGLKMLGFDVLLVNSFFKKKKWKAYWGRYMFGLYFYSIFFSLLYVLFLNYFMPQEVGDNHWLVIALIVIPATLFNILNIFGGRYYQLSQKPQYVSLVTVIVGVVSILMNLYTIAYLKLGYLGWFLSTATGSFISFLLYAYPIFKKVELKPILTTNKNFWKKSLKVALPTIPHSYSTYLLNSSDRMVMDQLKTPIGQIGIYNLAYIFGGYMEFFGNAVGMAVGPMITGLYAKKTEAAEKQLQTLIFFLQIGFIVLCSIVSLWAKELFDFLIQKEELKVAYSISIIIIMGYAYRPLYWAAGMKIMFYEFTNKLWRISFVAGALNVILNLVFIPIYGIYAAAITTFISLMYLGLSPFYIKEYKALNNEKIYPVFWILIITFLTGLIFYLKDASITIKIFTSLAFIALFAIYMKKEKSKLNNIKI